MTRIQFTYRGLLIDAEFSPGERGDSEHPDDPADLGHIYSVEVADEPRLLEFLDPDELLEAAEDAYGETR